MERQRALGTIKTVAGVRGLKPVGAAFASTPPPPPTSSPVLVLTKGLGWEVGVASLYASPTKR